MGAFSDHTRRKKDFLKLGSNTDAATSNTMNIANECKNYRIKNICFMYYNQQPPALEFHQRCEQCFRIKLCKHDYIFIQNSNIVVLDHLWQDGFHLSNSEKGKLLNNYLVFLNKKFS